MNNSKGHPWTIKSKKIGQSPKRKNCSAVGGVKKEGQNLKSKKEKSEN